MSRKNAGHRPARFGQSGPSARAPKTARQVTASLAAVAIAGLAWVFFPSEKGESASDAVARIEQGFKGGLGEELKELGLGGNGGGNSGASGSGSGSASTGDRFDLDMDKNYVPTPLGPPDGPARSIRFGFCKRGGGSNCVVDGDSIRLNGDRIRIADIDTPETGEPRCAEEAKRGAIATERLHALLNNGKVQLHKIKRDTDKYGRKLRNVSVDGKNVGDILIAEGLARPYGKGRRPWCV